MWVQHRSEDAGWEPVRALQESCSSDRKKLVAVPWQGNTHRAVRILRLSTAEIAEAKSVLGAGA